MFSQRPDPCPGCLPVSLPVTAGAESTDTSDPEQEHEGTADGGWREYPWRIIENYKVFQI